MDQRVAVVTGANRGIGFAIVRNLAKVFNGSVYLTARNENSAKESVEKLKNEGVNCKFHQLDINDLSSIKRLAEYLKENYGGLDVLINNAGVICMPESKLPMKEQLKNTVNTNYFGTLNVCTTLFPLLRPHARVVNVTSDWGCIFHIKNQEIKKQLMAKDLTINKISSTMNHFIELAGDANYDDDIWESYMVSKNGCNALTGVQQKIFDTDRPEDDIIISAVHPGEVTTDMNPDHGTIMPDQSSETIVYLATITENPDIPKGAYWYEKKVLDWSDPNLDMSVFH